MLYLKADTSVKVVIGPVVAVGDGFTPVTTLSVSTADEAEILKHDAGSVTDISSNTFAAITGADGYYNLTITAAQLDTEGMLSIVINDDSLCLPVRHDYMVVNANVYDSLFAAAATDYLQVDSTQISGDATAADNLETMLDGTGGQTLSLGQLNISRTDSNANIVLAGSGAGNGIDFTRTGTGDPLDTNFMAQINAEVDTAISDAALATAASLATVDANVDAILVDTGTSIPATLATIDTNVDAVLVDTNELQADWANGGRLDLILDARASQTTADAIETDTQDIQSRLPAALVSGKMDSDVTAISGDTVAADRLEAAMDSVVTGTAQTGTLSTTQMTTDLSEATDDHYIGRLITWKTGALAGQQTDVTDYSGTNGLLTFTAVTEAPSNGDTFVIT